MINLFKRGIISNPQTLCANSPHSMLSEEDAKAQTAPHILLASPDESEKVVSKYEEILSQPGMTGEVETYKSMFYGWMGARSNLEDGDNLSEFNRGYQQVGRFFSRYL